MCLSEFQENVGIQIRITIQVTVLEASLSFLARFAFLFYQFLGHQVSGEGTSNSEPTSNHFFSVHDPNLVIASCFRGVLMIKMIIM